VGEEISMITFLILCLHIMYNPKVGLINQSVYENIPEAIIM